MRQLLQFKARLNSKIFVFILLFFWIPKNAFSSDTVYVKFLDVKIALNPYGYQEFKGKDKKLYLFFEGLSDSVFHCYVIRKDKIIASGILKIISTEPYRTALRTGYWRRGKYKDFINDYYDDDVKMIEIF